MLTASENHNLSSKISSTEEIVEARLFFFDLPLRDKSKYAPSKLGAFDLSCAYGSL